MIGGSSITFLYLIIAEGLSMMFNEVVKSLFCGFQIEGI